MRDGMKSGRAKWQTAARLALLATTIGAVAIPQMALAQDVAAATAGRQASFDVPPQSLDTALTRVADQAGVRIFFASGDVAGMRSPGVRGTMRVEEALSRVLTGTGFTWRDQGDGTIAIQRAPQAVDGAINLGPVRVEAGAGGEGAGAVPVAPPTAVLGTLPPPYAGGQIARGSQVGVLGNLDFLETPYSTTSFTEQTIVDTQAIRPRDVLVRDPSIRPWVESTGLNDQYTLRGFLQGAGDEAINGVYGIAGIWASAAEPVERIEVIKGPNASLTGLTPVGGSINYVTKQATDTPITRVIGRHASRAQFGGHLDVGRRFGEGGMFGLRANYAYREGRQFRPGEVNEAETFSIAGDFRSEDVRVAVDYIRNRFFLNSLYQFAAFDTSIKESLFAPVYRSDGYPVLNQSLLVRAEVDLSDNITASFAYGHSWLDYEVFQVFNIFDEQNLPTDQFGQFYRDQNGESDVGQATIRAQFDTGPISHRLAVSGLLTKTYTNFFQTDTGPVITLPAGDFSGPANPFRPDIDPPLYSRGRNTSFAVTDTLGLFDDRLLLTAGARYQHVRTVQYPYADFGITYAVYSASAITPTFAALFKASDRLSIYGNYIEGLEPGPVAPLNGSGAGTPDNPVIENPGQVFPPSRTQQFELGAKLDLGSFAITGAAFQISRPSSILRPGSQPNSVIFSVNGEQRNRGIELSFFGEPLKGIRLFGGLTLLDAQLIRTQDGINEGNTPAGIPRRTITLTAEADIAQLPGLTLTAGTTAVSEQYRDDTETLTIPGFATLDLGLRYTFAGKTPITVRANVTNALNKYYFTSAFGQAGTPGTPRTVLISASVDF